MDYQASSLAFPKKLSNGHSFSGNTIHDGVFAAPPKFSVPNFSTGVEDYREIFGGSETSLGSSIPFLEVPELNEPKISVDVRSSNLDYSNIFGGFGDSNFAVPYEEFSRETNKRKKSERARTPAQRLSPPEAAKESSITELNHDMAGETVHQVKKFNVSYNKINNGNANGTRGTNGTTYIAQLHAVRGYARLIDEDDKPVFSEVNGTVPKANVCEGITEGNNVTRVKRDVPAGETGKQTSVSGAEFQNNSNWFKSHSMDKSFNKDEVRPETLCSKPKVKHCSSLPPYINLDKAEGIFRTDTAEGSSGVHSPPFFYEEIDKNSVAATSAAALTKAIEEAQARIKMAKELMERKKAGMQNRVKLSFNDGVKPEERKEDKVAYKVNKSKKKKSHELCEEVNVPLHVSPRTREKSPVGPFQVTADLEVQEEVDGETTPWMKTSSQVDYRWEEVEASEAAEHFYEVENTGEQWSATIEVNIPSPVSAVTRNQNAMGPGIEVQEFVSTTKEATRETFGNNLRSSQVDHRQENAEPLEAAEQFYEIENSDKNWIKSSEFKDVKEKKVEQEAFEKPKPAEEENHPEKLKNGISRLNGVSGASDFGVGGGKSMSGVDVFDLEKIDQKQAAQTKGENEKIAQALYESNKCEKYPIEFQEDVDYMKRQSPTWDCVGKDKKEEEALEPKEYEKERINPNGVEDIGQRFVSRVNGEEISGKSLYELHLGKKIANILVNDGKSEGNDNLGETGGNEKILEEDASHEEVNESRQGETCQRVEIERMEAKIDPSPGDDEKVKTTLEEQCNQGNNFGAADDLCQLDKSDNLSTFQKSTLHAENDSVEVSEEISDSFLEPNGSGNKLESVKENYDMGDRYVPETDGFSQGLELTKIMKPMEDKMESAFLDKIDTENVGSFDSNFIQNPDDQDASKFELVCNSRMYVEEVGSEIDKAEDKESFLGMSQVDDESNTETEGSDEQKWADNGITMKASELSDTSEVEGVTIEPNEEPRTSSSTEKDQEYHEETPISLSVEGKENNHQETLPCQSVETNEESHRSTVTLKESETSGSLQKDMKLEKEHLRKINEAKERERTKEERIAVERAIREARERAFAEARERAAAGRAAAGARKKVTAEARERVGKTSSEPDKEAKLKAQRAAVERATAEARERALEKAMSGKFASEARKQNPPHKGSCSASTSRYPNSSEHVSNTAERFDGATNESAERCKARSERHHRITERAEKALAEKNRRDLLAQKEQAERHRLAETLDIEVRRWSGGKEGNLRALLSTLQYILGPDSGWQPIPLTDILTAAAVKKAYRKATLFVHPDKLQQRGANIQQKYTCEKVFDLLKEAWNRFNVEER
ncbi:auxilin-like protein 1 [Humulus lupulus]|uniref:auxilin-like protein 1 n=1 Tax=Humulus lupulus TaxID=3486 RepID=UPI002B41408F|nr:auxilin-like protein 1 [Humulus lupulus]XP_062098811.1 auxilin-like protein 1 [Humulus lupulus]XP_062098812.1 auxilin-like protein 1 [Humulus lupulus]